MMAPREGRARPRGLVSACVLLGVLLWLPSPSLSSVSSDQDYRLVFSEGIAHPFDESLLYYTSARKFQSTGDPSAAAKLYRTLAAGPDARVRAAAFARLGEMEADAGRFAEGVVLLGEALGVCLGAGGVGLACGGGWVGWGVGSCCSIAALAGRALQDSGQDKASLSMLRLARHLTPSYRPPAPPLHPPPRLPLKKAVLLMAASGAYSSFITPLIESARRFFLVQCCSVSYVVFTDNAAYPGLRGLAGVTLIERPELGWPMTAMMRYRHYTDNWHLIGHADYAYSIDVDCLFVAPVGEEVLAPTVGTTHADNAHYDGSEMLDFVHRMAASGERGGGMWLQGEAHELLGRRDPGRAKGFSAGDAVYERRNESTAYIPLGGGTRYYYSGFYGGEVRRFGAMVRTMAIATEADLARGLIARVHDESHINRYWADHPPATVLTAAYMFPEAAVLRDGVLCRPSAFCPRDYMHPWLWSPWRSAEWDSNYGWDPQLWGSTPIFVPRILNLAKDKSSLIEQKGRTAAAPIRYRGWSADLHIGPIGDVKRIFRALGVEVVDKSMSAHCTREHTCAQDLKALNASVALTLGEDVGGGGARERLMRDFFEAYKDDPEMSQIDFFICIHPTSLCELYTPFSKGMLVYATTRFDLGRQHSTESMARWVSVLTGIAAKGDAVVAANSVYDAAYVEYFTGIIPRVIPSLCSSPYTYVWPSPRKQILLDVCDDSRCPPFRQKAVRELLRGLSEQVQASGQGLSFAELRSLYPNYSPTDLVQHPAVVWLPYQVSVMSFFERQAMGLPIFVPSLDLLVTWHMQFGLVFERRIDWQTAGARRGSLLQPHSGARREISAHDPNDERSPEAVRAWLARADFYQYPGVVLFSSWGHLVELLKTTDLEKVSADVRRHHAALEREVHASWKDAVRVVTGGFEPGGRSGATGA